MHVTQIRHIRLAHNKQTNKQTNVSEPTQVTHEQQLQEIPSTPVAYYIIPANSIDPKVFQQTSVNLYPHSLRKEEPPIAPTNNSVENEEINEKIDDAIDEIKEMLEEKDNEKEVSVKLDSQILTRQTGGSNAGKKSALIPGLGQLFDGRLGAAAAWFTGVTGAVLGTGFAAYKLPAAQKKWGLIAGIPLSLTLYAANIADAANGKKVDK